ncbi:hypothetical protein J4479_04380 [Candidatus Woesearchaeota archaeon]|nr:hypothetical protein [Candidatus Woesearchaeota archaeon]
MSQAKLRFFDSLYTARGRGLITEEIAGRSCYKPLSVGHIGVEIDEQTYGFTPQVKSLDKITLKGVQEGLTTEDTPLFTLAGEILKVGEKEIELAENSRQIIFRDYQNRTILPYALLPHLVRQPSYNCISYLRDRAGIRDIPLLNHLASVIKALSH